MATKIGINGFGRIGRLVYRAALQRDDIEVVAINDLGDAATLVHLANYDSVHGRLSPKATLEDGYIVCGSKKAKLVSERDPTKLPWGELGVEYVCESTGVFRKRADAAKHLEAGAKKVIISAPSPDADHTICMGVNHDTYEADKHHVISNASCTTNCLSQMVKPLQDAYGIKRGLMTTIHAYTNDQKILDLPHKDLRRARSAAISMIPTSTGAAKAISLVMPELEGKLNGGAVRVPTQDVSLTDLTVEVEKGTTAEEVNALFKKAAESGPQSKFFDYCDEPLVSIDFTTNPASCTLDALSTQVIDGTMIKILGWYDNEYGYANRVIDLMDLMNG